MSRVKYISHREVRSLFGHTERCYSEVYAEGHARLV
jgi:hypothetical protein